jgi:hypothetical protein
LIFLAEQIPPSSEEDSCYLFSSCYQCTTVCRSSWKQWKNKIHAFELQQLQLGIAQGIGCLGFSLSLSRPGNWMLRVLVLSGFSLLSRPGNSMFRVLVLSGFSLSLSLSVFTGSGF